MRSISFDRTIRSPKSFQSCTSLEFVGSTASGHSAGGSTASPDSGARNVTAMKSLRNSSALLSPQSLLTDNAVLVNRYRDGHRRHLQQVQRVDQNRPVHLLPLHEQTAAIRVLLLDDPHNLKLAGFVAVFTCLVPPGHVFAASRSPGCEDMKQCLLSSKLHNRRRPAVFE